MKSNLQFSHRHFLIIPPQMWCIHTCLCSLSRGQSVQDQGSICVPGMSGWRPEGGADHWERRPSPTTPLPPMTVAGQSSWPPGEQ